jgi:hypothetical protein
MRSICKQNTRNNTNKWVSNSKWTNRKSSKIYFWFYSKK